MPMPSGSEMDTLMSAMDGRRCPLCAGLLRTDKERWGWGSQGGRLKCINCGLRLRLRWVPLRKAILKAFR